MEKIVGRNLEIYSDMKSHLGRFKKLLKEEEDASKNVRNTFYYWHFFVFVSICYFAICEQNIHSFNISIAKSIKRE